MGIFGTLRQRLRGGALLLCLALSYMPATASAEASLTARIDEADALVTHGRDARDHRAVDEAIQRYEVMAAGIVRKDDPLGWAAIQSGLCRAQWGRGERDIRNIGLFEAIETCRAALEERPRERVPRDWAATQTNLAHVLLTLGHRETGTARLEEAAQAFREALQERPRDVVPLEWAATQNGFAITLNLLGERKKDSALLRQAIEANEAALQVRQRSLVPLDWAKSLTNLGIASAGLAAHIEDFDLWLQAATAQRSALEELTRERYPHLWATVQSRLGAALSALGRAESRRGRRGESIEHLEQALDAYGAVQQQWSRESLPWTWADFQHKRGSILHLIGQQEVSNARLEQALDVYRQALAERTGTPTTGPELWAETQTAIGEVLMRLGERERQRYYYEQAVAAFRLVADRQPYGQYPRQWVLTQNRIGNALVAMQALVGGRDLLEQALRAFKAARSTYREGSSGYAYYDRQMATVTALLAEVKAP